jgi:hypothetical protein
MSVTSRVLDTSAFEVLEEGHDRQAVARIWLGFASDLGTAAASPLRRQGAHFGLPMPAAPK